MDTNPYHHYMLTIRTVELAKRIKRENPTLWAQIEREAEEIEIQLAAERAQREVVYG